MVVLGFRRIMTALLLMLLAGCSTVTGTPSASPSSEPTSTSAVAPKTATIQAVANPTQLNSNCDPQITGDCWLPLYPAPSTTGVPLNMSTATNATCQKTLASDTPDQKSQKEKLCWPQPGDAVTLLCIKTVNQQIWFGAKVSKDKVLTPADGKPAQDAIGFALAVFFDLNGEAGTLPICPAG